MPNPGDRKRAARSALLSGLPADLVDAILDQSVARSHERGATIFLQGEPARTVYVVLEGWVKLFRISRGGAESVVGCFTIGQSFAEPAVMMGRGYPVAAEAATDCRLLHVQGVMLFDLMERRPEIIRAIFATMYRHFHELVSQIEQLKAHNGAQRVAEFLLDLCPTESGSCAVRLPYDKVLIAGRLGMKPESLSRAFGRLRPFGVDIRQDTAAISDIARLRAYAGIDEPVDEASSQ